MKRYKLPDELGGHEVEVLHGMARDDGRSDIVIQLPTGRWYMTVLPHMLVEVKPPLPEEPTEPRTVVWSGLPDGRGGAWEKSNSGHWYGMGTDGKFSWADVCSYGTPVVIYPPPKPERVALPWRMSDPDVEVDHTIGCGCHSENDGERLVSIEIEGGTVHLEPHEARAMAAAMVSAAGAER
jgi:hypothetical protein